MNYIVISLINGYLIAVALMQLPCKMYGKGPKPYNADGSKELKKYDYGKSNAKGIE